MNSVLDVNAEKIVEEDSQEIEYENEENHSNAEAEHAEEDQEVEHDEDDNTVSDEDELDICKSFQEVQECENCHRLMIVDFELDSVEADEDGEREMGCDLTATWNMYGICPTCETEIVDDVSESIYMSGMRALNAEDRDPTVLLEDCTFLLEGLGVGQPQLSCMNADKGDCIVLRLGSTLVLYDTGYKNCRQRILREIARPENNGMSHCLVIVSHKDRDHAGGYPQLVLDLQHMYENAHIVYEQAQENDGWMCHSDAPIFNNQVHFAINNMHVTCYLAPENVDDSNGRSIVAVIQHGQWISVLTGDQYLPQVMNLVNTYHSGSPIHTFQIPHHGSAHNYQGHPLPRAVNYLVSGCPQHDKNMVNAYNRNCQILAVQSAAAACNNVPFNICFTKPYLNQQIVTQHSPNATLVVPNVNTQAIRLNL